MEQAQSTSVARRFEDLTNLFYLMVALPLVGFIWVYLNLRQMQPWGYFKDPSWSVFLHVVLLVPALLLGLLAFVQYRKRFNGLEVRADDLPAGDRSGDSRSIDSGNNEEQLSREMDHKLDVFRAASLQKYMLLTASTVLVVIGFYLSAEEFYGALYALMIIVFSVHRPTPERFGRDMRLKKEERKALREAINRGRRLPQQEEK